MTRRIVAISVAIALAALGTIGGVYLVLSADSRARSAINDAVTVLVAAKTIPVGTSGAHVRVDELVRSERMPRANVPSDSLTDFSSEYDKLVVTSTIAAGQILMKANFGDQSQVTSGLPLTDGKLAVTVQTGAPEQVAGYVQVGSQVAIFLTYKVVNSDGTPTSIERTRVLLPRVEVLAIGTYSSDSSAQNTSSQGQLLVTLAVNQGDAERLIEGTSHGTLYLALLTDSVDVKQDQGVDNTDSGDGSSPLFK